MTYAIVWDETAIDAAARFLKDDPVGLRQLMDAVDLLAEWTSTGPRMSATREPAAKGHRTELPKP